MTARAGVLAEQRMLILAPFGRDSVMLHSTLDRAGIDSLICRSMAFLCEELPRGNAGLLITEEALTDVTVQELIACLDAQEAWSDIPLIVLLSGGVGSQHATQVVEALGLRMNVTYIERPMRATTLLSAVESMRRSRRRQYEVRDLIEAYAEAEASERAARAEAEAAIGMRDEFLGVASHELRTPLTVVMGYAETLAGRARRGTLDPAASVHVFDDLRMHAQRLDSLVGDLLDTSRIQQGRLMLEPTRVHLNDLVATVVERFKRSGEVTEQHELCLEAPSEIIGLWDEPRLDQVLTNLISNALKYSPDGGRVTVTLASDPDQALICVADHGLGIAENRLGDLFQPFSRVHSDRRLVNGTGLGLYIAAQLVERHQGTITVDTELGVGTTFTVALPLRAMLDAERPAVARKIEALRSRPASA